MEFIGKVMPIQATTIDPTLLHLVTRGTLYLGYHIENLWSLLRWQIS